MFNLQGSEIIIILLLALVVLGPEKLPDAMRKAGQFYAELKKMSSGFQSEFRAAVDEPIKELRDTANVLRDSADFSKLQDGSRDEKPTSATMEPANPDDVPVADVPTFESPGHDDEPAVTGDSNVAGTPAAAAAGAASSPDALDGAARRANPVDNKFPGLEFGATVQAEPDPTAPGDEMLRESDQLPGDVAAEPPPAATASDAFGTISARSDDGGLPADEPTAQ